MTDPEDQEADEAVSELLGEEPTPYLLPNGTQGTPERHAFLPAKEATEEIVAVETTSDAKLESSANAREDEAESLESVVLQLPKHWMRVYVLELERSGLHSDARKVVRAKIGRIRPGLIAETCAAVPLFGSLVKAIEAERTPIVDEAVYRGATEGDEMPIVSQGEIVGSYKKRDTKAAEVYYKRHGLLAADQVNVTHGGRVELARDEDLPAILAEGLSKLLFAQPKPKAIEGKVVSESDKNG